MDILDFQEIKINKTKTETKKNQKERLKIASLQWITPFWTNIHVFQEFSDSNIKHLQWIITFNKKTKNILKIFKKAPKNKIKLNSKIIQKGRLKIINLQWIPSFWTKNIKILCFLGDFQHICNG